MEKSFLTVVLSCDGGTRSSALIAFVMFTADAKSSKLHVDYFLSVKTAFDCRRATVALPRPSSCSRSKDGRPYFGRGSGKMGSGGGGGGGELCNLFQDSAAVKAFYGTTAHLEDGSPARSTC